MQDVKKVYELFLDEQRSSRKLQEYQNEYLFHEVEDTSAMETN
jgi:hypothetical protein